MNQITNLEPNDENEGQDISSYKQIYRNSTYDLKNAINEFVDNIIKKCSEIKIKSVVNDDSRLFELKISDNLETGFEGIEIRGKKSPFKWGSSRIGHKDDNETSEYGLGMKAGAIACCDMFVVYTRLGDKYYKREYNYVEMSKKEDIIESLKPTFLGEITESEYKNKHPFDYGSSLVLSSIRNEIFGVTDQKNMTDYIIKNISNTYGEFIKKFNKKIYVDDKLVSHNYCFFDDPNCSIFTITKKIYYLKKNNDTKIIIDCVNENKKKIFNNNKKILEACKDDIATYINDGYESYGKNSESDMSCLILDSTFTYFSDKFMGDDKDDIPGDKVEIYKDNRNHGETYIAKSRNGIHNYTLHRIRFNSKKIGNEIGITFNKKIELKNEHDFVKAIIKCIEDNKSNFSADRPTKKFAGLYKNAIDNNIQIPDNKKPKIIIEPDPQPVPDPKPVPDPDPKPVPDPDPKPVPPPSPKSDELYLYLIQKVENLGSNIYKIGKTNKEYPFDRFKEFLKGYKVIIIFKIKNDNLEDIIKEEFGKKYERPYGDEYFIGDIDELKWDFINLIQKHETK